MTTTTRKLGDIARIRAGFQTRGRIQERADGTHALLQLRDFNVARTTIQRDKMLRLTPGRINPEQLLRRGDLVFLSKGSRNFAFLPEDLPEPMLVAPYFFIVRPSDLVDSGYLSWFLNLSSTQHHLARTVGRGVHMPVVRRGYLEDLEIPLPSMVRQQAIREADALAAHRQRLMTELATKQRLLTTVACRRAAEADTMERED